MSILVYGRNVEFSEKEVQIFTECGLELDSTFLELILHWNAVDKFDNHSTDDERHDICIEAIKQYSSIIEKTLSKIRDTGLYDIRIGKRAGMSSSISAYFI